MLRQSPSLPLFQDFETIYNQQKPQLVYQRVISDLETPVSAYLKLAAEKPGSFLLESVEGGESLGRYSIIGMRPDIIWRAQGDKAQINRSPLTGNTHYTDEKKPVLDSFQGLLDESAFELPEDLPSMVAGVFGYFGYDLIRQSENLPNRPKGGIDIDDAIFIRPTIVVVFDNIKQELTIATPVRPTKDINAKAAFSRAHERLTDILSDMSRPISAAPPIPLDAREKIEFTSNTTPEDYKKMVLQAKDYIKAGDIFQVVLSQRFSSPFTAPPFELYRSLRRENPSPFLFFLNFESHAIVGSSPEILVRVEEGEITIRPIAGTRKRGHNKASDKALEEDLLADPKERAEHLMLLDLGRNDVGRSSKIGSVQVTDSFIIERYSHVMHIVSNVTGQLREDACPIDAMMAGFPAGTVSGAPKIRAMEIIDELEKEARNAYAGAIGYFSAGGNVDTAITLRTAVVKDAMMHVQAGAGIVTDSDPQLEHEECVNKASALLSAAQKVNFNHGAN